MKKIFSLFVVIILVGGWFLWIKSNPNNLTIITIKEKLGIIPIIQTQQNDRYIKTKTGIFLTGGYQLKADLYSFETLIGGYAKDKNNAFYKGKEIVWTDTGSFEIINPDYSLDKNHIYYQSEILSWVDPKTYDSQNLYLKLPSTETEKIGKIIQNKKNIIIQELGLSLDIPTTWSLFLKENNELIRGEKHSTKEIKIITDKINDKKNPIYVTLMINKIPEEELSIIKTDLKTDYEKVNNWELIINGCWGALQCYLFKINTSIYNVIIGEIAPTIQSLSQNNNQIDWIVEDDTISQIDSDYIFKTTVTIIKSLQEMK